MSVEQEEDFFRYYESRGFETVMADQYPKKRFQARPFLVDGKHLVQFYRPPVRSGDFGGDTWEHCPEIKTAPASALPTIEAERLEKLEKAKSELKAMETEAETEAETATKETRLRKQRHLVATLSVPFQLFVPHVRPDNELVKETFDSRNTTVPAFDRNIPDPTKETTRRFGRTIEG